MPSTITRALATRVPNAHAEALERMAVSSGQSVSALIAEAVASKLNGAQLTTASR